MSYEIWLMMEYQATNGRVVLLIDDDLKDIGIKN
jgi:hypothetical protein